MNRILSTCAALLVMALFSGCASQVYNTEYLKKPNRFAVVSVTGITHGFGLSDAEENKLITNIDKLVYTELKKSKHFKLATKKMVQKNRHYRAIKGESTDGPMTMKTAKGYKKFDAKKEAERINKLAKELKLTGVIYVVASFSKKDSGFSLSGLLPVPIPVTVGSTSGELMLNIVAMDTDNNVVWQDVVKTETKDSVGSVMGVSKVSNLLPQFLDTAQEAAFTAVNNLAVKMREPVTISSKKKSK